MKKLILFCTFLMLIVSCKSTSPTSVKVDQKAVRMMDGTWTITSVTTPMDDMIKINSFQLGDSQCFVGSRWKLVANNNKGDMSLNSANPGCQSFSSPITWYRNNNNQFVLKVLNAGEKARKVRDGYILDVANQTERSFELIDMVEVGGKRENVVYKFEKI